jgi:uncharacterized membrane protein YGL010W
VLAAVLAVLGYSVNESVVVFDRVRENFRKMRKRLSVPEVMDNAITSTISRTIITHGCTQMMVTVDPLLRRRRRLFYFALALTIGILLRHLLVRARCEPAGHVHGHQARGSREARAQARGSGRLIRGCRSPAWNG